MNLAQLLAHFDRVTDAPDAIPRLRRFILDLAVRGKLVPQDPNDEPASDLLKRIQAERVEAIRARHSNDELQATTEPMPFDPPASWQCVPLQRLIVFGPQNGVSPKPTTKPDAPRAVTLSATTKGAFDPNYFKRVEVSIPVDSEFWLRPGDLLFQRGNTRDYVGIAAYYSGEPGLFLYPDLMMKVRVSDRLCLRYVHLAAIAPPARSYFSRRASGAQASMPKINQGILLGLPIPVPPLAEQHRIVAKVDELMALCDRLEATQAERERRRDRLATASLHRLNQPADDAATFREHARFHLCHLPRLTTRPEQILQLRQTILDLAVRGKLVPQDPDDVPAAELLKRIQVERARLVREGEAKDLKQPSVAHEAKALFKIPGTWCWVTLGELAFGFRYGTSVKCSHEPTGEPVLRIPNVNNGRLSIEDLKYGTLPEREAHDLRLQLGDIVMVRSNGSLELVGRAALVEPHVVGYCYAGYLVRVRTSANHLNTRYVLLALSTAHVRDQIEIPIRTTVGLKNVNATELSRLRLTLPPLAEQHRIVAKVDDLMALCDRLEGQLTTAQTESRRLLEAVLHEALAPVT